MSIRLHLRRALLRAKIRALLALKRLLERIQGARRPDVRRPPCEPPTMTFEVEPGVIYGPELQALVADCRKRATADFVAFAVGKLQHERTLEPDWPTSINVRVASDRIEWSLTSHSGHLFVGRHPDASLSARRN